MPLLLEPVSVWFYAFWSLFYSLYFVDRKEYLFRSFWERDDCYSLLQDLVNKAKVKASRHMSAPSGLSSEMSTSKKISLPIQSQGSQSVDNNASTKTETGVENNVGVVIQAKSIPSSSGLISSSSSSSNKDQASLGGNYVEEEETDSGEHYLFFLG